MPLGGHIFFRRFVALLLSISLSATFPIPAYSLDTAGINIPHSMLDPSLIKIPEHLGKIEESFKGSSGKLVIYIQDAHTNYSAQKNIAAIIDKLVSEIGIRLVTVEAAEGDIETNLFRSFPIPEVSKRVMDKFLRTGEIGGPQYASITGKVPFEFVGVDKSDLYKQNLGEFLSVLADRESGDAFIRKAKLGVTQLKTVLYSKEARDLDRLIETHASQFTDLLSFLNRLRAKADELGEPLDDYAHLSKLMEYAEKLKNKEMPEDTVREEFKSVDPILLFNEIEHLSFELKYKLAGSEEARQLIRLERYVGLLEHGFSLELTREDAGKLKGMQRDFEREKIISYLETLSKRHRLDVSYLEEMRSVPLDEYTGRIFRFYEGAAEREKEFEKRLKREMLMRFESSAVLVTGGYHREGMLKRLREAGISYAVITPVIDELTDHEKYLALMQKSGALLSIAPVTNNIGVAVPNYAFGDLGRQQMAAMLSALYRESTSEELETAADRLNIDWLVGRNDRSKNAEFLRGQLFSHQMRNVAIVAGDRVIPLGALGPILLKTARAGGNIESKKRGLLSAIGRASFEVPPFAMTRTRTVETTKPEATSAGFGANILDSNVAPHVAQQSQTLPYPSPSRYIPPSKFPSTKEEFKIPTVGPSHRPPEYEIERGSGINVDANFRKLKGLLSRIYRRQKRDTTARSDLSKIRAKALELNPKFKTQLTDEELKQAGPDAFEYFLNELDEQVFLPYDRYLGLRDKHGLFEWKVYENTWKAIPYLGSVVWESEGRNSSKKLRSILSPAIAPGRKAIYDSEEITRLAEETYRLITVQPALHAGFSPHSFYLRLQQLVRETSIGLHDYVKLNLDVLSRHEIRHAKDFAFTELWYQQSLDTDLTDKLKLIEAILRTDSTLRRTDYWPNQPTLDLQTRFQAEPIGELAVRLASNVEVMDHYLELGQPQLAYAVFLRFLAEEYSFLRINIEQMRQALARRKTPSQETYYNQTASLLFLSFADTRFFPGEVKISAANILKTIEVENDLDATARRAKELLREIYAKHFWTDAERAEFLRHRDALWGNEIVGFGAAQYGTPEFDQHVGSIVQGLKRQKSEWAFDVEHAVRRLIQHIRQVVPSEREEEYAKYLSQELKTLSAETGLDLFEINEPSQENLWITTAKFRGPNPDGPVLLLNAHIDSHVDAFLPRAARASHKNVLEILDRGEIGKQELVVSKDGALRSVGGMNLAADNKTSVQAVFSIIEALARRNVPFGEIRVAFTTREEHVKVDMPARGLVEMSARGVRELLKNNRSFFDGVDLLIDSDMPRDEANRAPLLVLHRDKTYGSSFIGAAELDILRRHGQQIMEVENGMTTDELTRATAKHSLLSYVIGRVHDERYKENPGADFMEYFRALGVDILLGSLGVMDNDQASESLKITDYVNQLEALTKSIESILKNKVHGTTAGFGMYSPPMPRIPVALSDDENIQILKTSTDPLKFRMALRNLIASKRFSQERLAEILDESAVRKIDSINYFWWRLAIPALTITVPFFVYLAGFLTSFRGWTGFLVSPFDFLVLSTTGFLILSVPIAAGLVAPVVKWFVFRFKLSSDVATLFESLQNLVADPSRFVYKSMYGQFLYRSQKEEEFDKYFEGKQDFWVIVLRGAYIFLSVLEGVALMVLLCTGQSSITRLIILPTLGVGGAFLMFVVLLGSPTQFGAFLEIEQRDAERVFDELRKHHSEIEATEAFAKALLEEPAFDWLKALASDAQSHEGLKAGYILAVRESWRLAAKEAEVGGDTQEAIKDAVRRRFLHVRNELERGVRFSTAILSAGFGSAEFGDVIIENVVEPISFPSSGFGAAMSIGTAMVRVRQLADSLPVEIMPDKPAPDYYVDQGRPVSDFRPVSLVYEKGQMQQITEELDIPGLREKGAASVIRGIAQAINVKLLNHRNPQAFAVVTQLNDIANALEQSSGFGAEIKGIETGIVMDDANLYPDGPASGLTFKGIPASVFRESVEKLEQIRRNMRAEALKAISPEGRRVLRKNWREWVLSWIDFDNERPNTNDYPDVVGTILDENNRLLDQHKVIQQVIKVAEDIRARDGQWNEVRAWFNIGIGGSTYPTHALVDILNGSSHNDMPYRLRGAPKLLYTGDSFSPEVITGKLIALEANGELFKTVFNVISKSGTTAETAAAYLIIREWLRLRLGEVAKLYETGKINLDDLGKLGLSVDDIRPIYDNNDTERKQPKFKTGRFFVMTTGFPENQEAGSALYQENFTQYQSEDGKAVSDPFLAMLPVPIGSGSRFTTFSVALLPLAVTANKLKNETPRARVYEAVRGAKAAFKEYFAESDLDVMNSIPFRTALINYLAEHQMPGTPRRILDIYGYDQELKSLADLADELHNEGVVKFGRGMEAKVHIGSNENHLSLEGMTQRPGDRLAWFWQVGSHAPLRNPVIPSEAGAIGGIPLGQVQEFSALGTQRDFASKGLLNYRWVLPEKTAFHVGAFIYALQTQIAVLGQMTDMVTEQRDDGVYVDYTYLQPGVEGYKKQTHQLLSAYRDRLKGQPLFKAGTAFQGIPMDIDLAILLGASGVDIAGFGVSPQQLAQLTAGFGAVVTKLFDAPVGEEAVRVESFVNDKGQKRILEIKRKVNPSVQGADWHYWYRTLDEGGETVQDWKKALSVWGTTRAVIPSNFYSAIFVVDGRRYHVGPTGVDVASMGFVATIIPKGTEMPMIGRQGAFEAVIHPDFVKSVEALAGMIPNFNIYPTDRSTKRGNYTEEIAIKDSVRKELKQHLEYVKDKTGGRRSERTVDIIGDEEDGVILESAIATLDEEIKKLDFVRLLDALKELGVHAGVERWDRIHTKVLDYLTYGKRGIVEIMGVEVTIEVEVMNQSYGDGLEFRQLTVRETVNGHTVEHTFSLYTSNGLNQIKQILKAVGLLANLSSVVNYMEEEPKFIKGENGLGQDHGKQFIERVKKLSRDLLGLGFDNMTAAQEEEAKREAFKSMDDLLSGWLARKKAEQPAPTQPQFERLTKYFGVGTMLNVAIETLKAMNAFLELDKDRRIETAFTDTREFKLRLLLDALNMLATENQWVTEDGRAGSIRRDRINPLDPLLALERALHDLTAESAEVERAAILNNPGDAPSALISLAGGILLRNYAGFGAVEKFASLAETGVLEFKQGKIVEEFAERTAEILRRGQTIEDKSMRPGGFVAQDEAGEFIYDIRLLISEFFIQADIVTEAFVREFDSRAVSSQPMISDTSTHRELSQFRGFTVHLWAVVLDDLRNAIETANQGVAAGFGATFDEAIKRVQELANDLPDELAPGVTLAVEKNRMSGIHGELDIPGLTEQDAAIGFIHEVRRSLIEKLKSHPNRQGAFVVNTLNRIAIALTGKADLDEALALPFDVAKFTDSLLYASWIARYGDGNVYRNVYPLLEKLTVEQQGAVREELATRRSRTADGTELANIDLAEGDLRFVMGSGFGADDEVNEQNSAERELDLIFNEAGLNRSEVTGWNTALGAFVPTSWRLAYEILDALPIPRDRHVVILDAGHGEGEWSLQLAHRFPQAEVIGIESEERLFDLSERILKAAERRSFVRPEQIRFFHGDFNEKRFAEYFRRADFVYYFNAGTNDLKTFVETLTAHLRPGARLIEYGVIDELRPMLVGSGVDFNVSEITIEGFPYLKAFTRAGFGAERVRVEVEREATVRNLMRAAQEHVRRHWKGWAMAGTVCIAGCGAAPTMSGTDQPKPPVDTTPDETDSALNVDLSQTESYFDSSVGTLAGIAMDQRHPTEAAPRDFTQPAVIAQQIFNLAAVVSGKPSTIFDSPGDAEAELSSMVNKLVDFQEGLSDTTDFAGLLPWMDVFSDGRLVADRGEPGKRATFIDNIYLTLAMESVRGAFASTGREDHPIAVQALRFITNQREGYRKLYDADRGLLRFGISNTGRFMDGHVDRLVQETAPGIVYVIARYDIPDNALTQLYDQAVDVVSSVEIDGKNAAFLKIKPGAEKSFQGQLPFTVGTWATLWPLDRWPLWARIYRSTAEVVLDYLNQNGLTAPPAPTTLPPDGYALSGMAGTGIYSEVEPTRSDLQAAYGLYLLAAQADGAVRAEYVRRIREWEDDFGFLSIGGADVLVNSVHTPTRRTSAVALGIDLGLANTAARGLAVPELIAAGVGLDAGVLSRMDALGQQGTANLEQALDAEEQTGVGGIFSGSEAEQRYLDAVDRMDLAFPIGRDELNPDEAVTVLNEFLIELEFEIPNVGDFSFYAYNILIQGQYGINTLGELQTDLERHVQSQDGVVIHSRGFGISKPSAAALFAGVVLTCLGGGCAAVSPGIVNNETGDVTQTEENPQEALQDRINEAIGDATPTQTIDVYGQTINIFSHPNINVTDAELVSITQALDAVGATKAGFVKRFIIIPTGSYSGLFKAEIFPEEATILLQRSEEGFVTEKGKSLAGMVVDLVNRLIVKIRLLDGIVTIDFDWFEVLQEALNLTTLQAPFHIAIEGDILARVYAHPDTGLTVEDARVIARAVEAEEGPYGGQDIVIVPTIIGFDGAITLSDGSLMFEADLINDSGFGASIGVEQDSLQSWFALMRKADRHGFPAPSNDETFAALARSMAGEHPAEALAVASSITNSARRSEVEAMIRNIESSRTGFGAAKESSDATVGEVINALAELHTRAANEPEFVYQFGGALRRYLETKYANRKQEIFSVSDFQISAARVLVDLEKGLDPVSGQPLEGLIYSAEQIAVILSKLPTLAKMITGARPETETRPLTETYGQYKEILARYFEKAHKDLLEALRTLDDPMLNSTGTNLEQHAFELIMGAWKYGAKGYHPALRSHFRAKSISDLQIAALVIFMDRLVERFWEVFDLLMQQQMKDLKITDSETLRKVLSQLLQEDDIRAHFRSFVSDNLSIQPMEFDEVIGTVVEEFIDAQVKSFNFTSVKNYNMSLDRQINLAYRVLYKALNEFVSTEVVEGHRWSFADHDRMLEQFELEPVGFGAQQSDKLPDTSDSKDMRVTYDQVIQWLRDVRTHHPNSQKSFLLSVEYVLSYLEVTVGSDVRNDPMPPYIFVRALHEVYLSLLRGLNPVTKDPLEMPPFSDESLLTWMWMIMFSNVAEDIAPRTHFSAEVRQLLLNQYLAPSARPILDSWSSKHSELSTEQIVEQILEIIELDRSGELSDQGATTRKLNALVYEFEYRGLDSLSVLLELAKPEGKVGQAHPEHGLYLLFLAFETVKKRRGRELLEGLNKATEIANMIRSHPRAGQRAENTKRQIEAISSGITLLKHELERRKKGNSNGSGPVSGGAGFGIEGRTAQAPSRTVDLAREVLSAINEQLPQVLVKEAEKFNTSLRGVFGDNGNTITSLWVTDVDSLKAFYKLLKEKNLTHLVRNTTEIIPLREAPTKEYLDEISSIIGDRGVFPSAELVSGRGAREKLRQYRGERSVMVVTDKDITIRGPKGEWVSLTEEEARMLELVPELFRVMVPSLQRALSNYLTLASNTLKAVLTAA